MINSRRIASSLAFFCLGIAFLYLKGLDGKLIDRPMNQVVELGEQVFLRCSSNLDNISWQFSDSIEDPAPEVVVKSAGLVTRKFADNYITGLRSKPCEYTTDLTVKVATLRSSGIYFCYDKIVQEDGYTVQHAGALTVVDPKIRIIRRKSQTECEIVYSSPKSPAMYPLISWIDPFGQEMESDANTSTRFMARSVVMVPQEKSAVYPFRCRAKFVWTNRAVQGVWLKKAASIVEMGKMIPVAVHLPEIIAVVNNKLYERVTCADYCEEPPTDLNELLGQKSMETTTKVVSSSSAVAVSLSLLVLCLLSDCLSFLSRHRPPRFSL